VVVADGTETRTGRNGVVLEGERDLRDGVFHPEERGVRVESGPRDPPRQARVNEEVAGAAVAVATEEGGAREHRWELTERERVRAHRGKGDHPPRPRIQKALKNRSTRRQALTREPEWGTRGANRA